MAKGSRLRVVDTRVMVVLVTLSVFGTLHLVEFFVMTAVGHRVGIACF